MRYFYVILMALLCHIYSATASTVISATLSITNSAALTNATSGQKYTLNGDVRTFTNSVASASTQIRVRTNDSAATILLSLVGQAGSYPFTGILSMTTSGGTNVTFRATNDTALTITLSPTNWGKVTYSTQTVGVVQTLIRVPMSAEESVARTNNATQLWSDLDAYSQTRTRGRTEFSDRVEFDAGFGMHGRYLVATNYTLTTNDLYLGVDTRSNTNLILTLPSAATASNLLFLIKDEGGAGATNTLKIYPASGDRIDTLLTNLVVSNNFGGVQLRSRGGTNWAILASGGGVTGGIASSGGNVYLTNSVWVSKNGSDSMGARGDVTKSYLTLGAAKTNAISGDTIFVLPGSYNEKNLLKTGVNWHFFNGAKVVYTGSSDGGIFDDSSDGANGAITSRITGSGVFTNANNNGWEVLHESDVASDIYFECLQASGGSASSYYYTIRAERGTLRIQGGVIIGWHSPAILLGGSGAGNIFIDGASIDSTSNDGSDGSNLGSGIVTGGTNTVTLRNCTVLGSSDGSWDPTTIYSVHAASARTVYIEGTLSANLPPNPNVTYTNVSYAGHGLMSLAGNAALTGNFRTSLTNSAAMGEFGNLTVTNNLSAPTNTAPFTIDATDFALDTNYTNGTQRAHVSVSLLLTSTLADTATVALYLDQDADTAFEQTGILVSERGLTTNSFQLGGWIQPGGVFTFTNLSAGAATAAVNAGGSQWVNQ